MRNAHSIPRACLAVAGGEHLNASNDDADDFTDEDLRAIDEEFGIDRRNLTRAVDQRAAARGAI